MLIAREAGAEVFDGDGSPQSFDSTFAIGSTPGVAPELMPIVQEAVDAVEPSSDGELGD